MSDRTYSAVRWKAITPSDTAKIEPRPTGVYASGAGVVIAVGDNGVSAPFGATDGQVLPIQPDQILATGTTATGLVALYN